MLKSVQPEFICFTTFPLQIRAGSGSSVLLESGKVLLLKIHRDPETGKVLNLVFAWADEGSELKVDVPLFFKGEDVCPGIKKGSLFVSLVLPFVTSVFVNGSVSVLLVPQLCIISLYIDLNWEMVNSTSLVVMLLVVNFHNFVSL